ncbi:MAG: shikimate kinase [Syntrophaceae bacterium]
MHIILIGYRGTGKSAVGKRLAKRLNLPFCDTDERIEKTAGRSIREVVAENGWEYFREREREVIREVAAMERSVIATGGGAVVDERNAGILKKHGLLIWLMADVGTIVQRIHRDKKSSEQRPAFSDNDIVQETADVLKKRTPVYNRLADFSIDTAGKNVYEIVDCICQFLGEKKETVCQEIPSASFLK